MSQRNRGKADIHLGVVDVRLVRRLCENSAILTGLMV